MSCLPAALLMAKRQKASFLSFSYGRFHRAFMEAAS